MKFSGCKDQESHSDSTRVDLQTSDLQKGVHNLGKSSQRAFRSSISSQSLRPCLQPAIMNPSHPTQRSSRRSEFQIAFRINSRTNGSDSTTKLNPSPIRLVQRHSTTTVQTMGRRVVFKVEVVGDDHFLFRIGQMNIRVPSGVRVHVVG